VVLVRKWSPNQLGTSSTVSDNIAAFVLDGKEFGKTPEFTSDQSEAESRIDEAVIIQMRTEMEKEITDRLTVEKEAEICIYQQKQNELYGNIETELKSTINSKINSLSEGAAELAIAMAGQVLRREINADKKTIINSIKPLLYKAESGAELTLSVNPVDAEFLKTQSQFCSEMNIVRVISDPRIEAGGCTAKTDVQEWDLTIESRLEVLAETVRETMQTSNIPFGDK
jgi:hypothetical protein